VRRRVTVTPEARADLFRLNAFLATHSLRAARRAMNSIDAGLRSLQHMPARARRISADLHELHVRFGQGGYVILFRIDHDAVVIARIFHMREDRPGA
jgi:plasmid stabilization system protein ParE